MNESVDQTQYGEPVSVANSVLSDGLWAGGPQGAMTPLSRRCFTRDCRMLGLCSLHPTTRNSDFYVFYIIGSQSFLETCFEKCISRNTENV